MMMMSPAAVQSDFLSLILRVVAHETVIIGCEKIPQDFSFVLPSQNGKTQIFLYERSV